MRAAIEADQLEKLRTLLAELRGRNDFYSRKLPAGVDIPTLASFAAQVPFTTKAELIEDQRAHLPYGWNLTYPLDRYTRFSQTNGTTGTPLRWLDTPASWDWMAGNWMRVFGAAGVAAADRIFFA